MGDRRWIFAGARGRLAALFGIVLAATAWAAARGPLPARPVECIGALVLAGAAWAGCVLLAWRSPGIRWVVAGAVALRCIALLGTFQTSDDHHRYAWEGGLVLAGKSPYAWAPSDPELEPERARWPRTYAGLNHPEVSAAYPPVAQAAFAAVVAATAVAARARELSGGVERAELGLRLFFAFADLLVLLPLAGLLARHGLPRARLVAWAWCPVVATEFAGSGHFDSLGILLLVGALAAAERGRAHRSAALLALGAMVKLLPALLLPFVARGRAGAVAAFAAPLAIAVAAAAALEGGLAGLGGGLAEYALRWEAASIVHRFLEAGFARAFAYDETLTDPRRLARALEAALWLGVGVLAWRRRATPAGAAFALLGAFLVLSPTLHPWYVTWIVPFLALRSSPAFLTLAASAPLLYAPLARWAARGEWVEPWWLWPAVALPFLALLLVELLSLRRTRAEEGA